MNRTARHRLWNVRPLAALLLAGALLLSACGSGGGSGEPGAEPAVGFDFSLAYLERGAAGAGSSSTAAAARFFTADDVFRGALLALNVSTFQTYTFDWSVYIDESTLEAQSNRTVILPPGMYNFSLLLLNGDHHYAGVAFLQNIVDGTNTVPLVIRPLIGNAHSDVTIVQELADFRFSYDPAELSGLANPQIGVLVDAEPERLYTVNATTGLSQHLFLNLVPGLHTMRLRLYDGNQQRGRSLPAQELVNVELGVNVTMDLVSLHGEVEIATDATGGDTTFRFFVPAEVVDEAGGLANLDAQLTATGATAGLQSAPVVLAPTAGAGYEGFAVLPGHVYGEPVAFSLAFSDVSLAIPERLGSCSQSVVLAPSPSTLICELVLRRRAVISGSLLATVAVNVFDTLNQPVPGAVVRLDGAIVGITGAGPTPGYTSFLALPGAHVLRAETAGLAGEQPVTVAPLSLNNFNITLDTPTGPGVIVVNETNLPEEADYCVLQWPPTTAAPPGAVTEPIFGRIFEAGLTEAAGASGSVLAELGFGPLGSDPRVSAAWSFIPGVFNVQIGNDDEYMASLTVPADAPPGASFAYTFRFSIDGGASFTYCDLDGAGSNPLQDFDPAAIGTLTVAFP